MEKIFELGNRFAKKSNWKDFALVKFCLCSIGILIGLTVPKNNKKSVSIFAGLVFLSTYVLLLKKIFDIIGEMKTEHVTTSKKNDSEEEQIKTANRYITLF